MKIFGQTLLDELAASATASPRGRAHHNVHASADDLLQRFFVVADRRSYFRPHRHNTKSEMAVVLRGVFDVLSFDAAGVVLARWRIGAGSGNSAYETPQGGWHTLLAEHDGSAFLEFKLGPYDPATTVEFASWAPAEGDIAVAQFQPWLRSAQPGDRYLPASPAG
jgi:cupin fold WbuC family metalloprotein